MDSVGTRRRLLVLCLVLAVAVGSLVGLVLYANAAARKDVERSAAENADVQEGTGEAAAAELGASDDKGSGEKGSADKGVPEDEPNEDEAGLASSPLFDPELSGWVTDDEGITRYFDPDTHKACVGWAEIEGARHYFDADGKKVTGWVHDEESGKDYWVKPEDGLLANHEWVEIDGVYQAFDDDGSLVTLGEVVPPNDEQNMAAITWRQQAVIDACDATPWPGKSLCAAWVSSVFANAGGPSVGGDACDMARAWCTSDDLADLKPGMLIAVPSHGRTDAGRLYGHVCIYIGGGLIRDSGTYGVRKSSLGSWLAWFGDLETPKWGWAGGVDLSVA